jgi:hypothetical protein
MGALVFFSWTTSQSDSLADVHKSSDVEAAVGAANNCPRLIASSNIALEALQERVDVVVEQNSPTHVVHSCFTRVQFDSGPVPPTRECQLQCLYTICNKQLFVDVVPKSAVRNRSKSSLSSGMLATACEEMVIVARAYTDEEASFSGW